MYIKLFNLRIIYNMYVYVLARQTLTVNTSGLYVVLALELYEVKEIMYHTNAWCLISSTVGK